MFKRLSLIAAVFFLMTAFINPAFAGTPYDSTKAIKDAVQNYSSYYQGEYNFNGDAIRYITSTGVSNITSGDGYSYGFLTYGQPHPQDDQRDRQYRYIGYTYYGEDYTNMDFPADKNANGADFASQNWISQPWENPDVIAVAPELVEFNPRGLPGDGDPKYHDVILAGIMAYGGTNANNGYTMSSSSNPEFWENIEQYVHILAPPTNYAWGIGRMWHYDENGYPWYVTVPIYPNALLENNNLKAVSLDLGAGAKAKPSEEYTATVVFENEAERSFTDVPVGLLHGQYQCVIYDENNKVLPQKNISGKNVYVADFGAKGKQNAKRTFTAKWHPLSGVTTDGLTGIVNRGEIAKVYQETTYDDNVVQATVPIDGINLKAVSINPGVYGEADPNSEYTATVVFKNESNETLTAVPVGGFNSEYRAYLKDAGGNDVQYADFGPGETKTFYFKYHTDSGDCLLKGVINTSPLEQKYNEPNYSDNVVTTLVEVQEMTEPVYDDPYLTLRAITQDGELWRPEGEAKWTDFVHATLTVPRPKPPKGHLDWWEISYAKLTYPCKNSEFTFGTPYPPEGTTVESMDVPGEGLESEKEATLVFQEDWAMDGAGIYSQLEGYMMAEDPRYYPITVNYKVTYQYSYRKCDEDSCWTVTKVKSYTSTAKESLLVNGTAVDSRAQ